MIDIILDTETKIAKLARTTAIKARAAVAVRVTLSAAPEGEIAFELALGTQAAPPEVLAYLDAFAAESDTVYHGVLDANDERLVEAIAGAQTLAVDIELAWTLGGNRFCAPNMSITVQQAIVDGPEAAEGGPNYLTDTQVEALVAPRVRLLEVDAFTGGEGCLDGVDIGGFLEGETLFLVKIGSGAGAAGHLFSLEAGDYALNTDPAAGQIVVPVAADPDNYAFVRLM